MKIFKKIKNTLCAYRCDKHKSVTPTVDVQPKNDKPFIEVALNSREGEIAYAENAGRARVLELADKLIVRSREIQADPRRQKRRLF